MAKTITTAAEAKQRSAVAGTRPVLLREALFQVEGDILYSSKRGHTFTEYQIDSKYSSVVPDLILELNSLGYVVVQDGDTLTISWLENSA